MIGLNIDFHATVPAKQTAVNSTKALAQGGSDWQLHSQREVRFGSKDKQQGQPDPPDQPDQADQPDVFGRLLYLSLDDDIYQI